MDNKEPEPKGQPQH